MPGPRLAAVKGSVPESRTSYDETNPRNGKQPKFRDRPFRRRSALGLVFINAQGDSKSMANEQVLALRGVDGDQPFRPATVRPSVAAGPRRSRTSLAYDPCLLLESTSMKCSRIGFAGVIALLLVVAVCVAISWRTISCPHTEARVWGLLQGPSSGPYGNYWLCPDARDEIREMGTNAIPCLVHALDVTSGGPSRLDRFIMRHPRLPVWITARYRPRWKVAEHVADAFGCLGPAAIPAIPSLLTRLSSSRTADAAGSCLMAMGPRAKSAVPALLIAIQNTNSAVRNAACGALICIDPEAASQAGLQ
jgi:hypothetical protein